MKKKATTKKVLQDVKKAVQEAEKFGGAPVYNIVHSCSFRGADYSETTIAAIASIAKAIDTNASAARELAKAFHAPMIKFGDKPK